MKLFVSRLPGFQQRGMHMTSPDPVLLQQLAQAHGFRLEALGANRAGLLSDAQAKDLGRARDVLLMAAVWVFQPGQMGTDRKLTLALAQALVQKLGR